MPPTLPYEPEALSSPWHSFPTEAPNRPATVVDFWGDLITRRDAAPRYGWRITCAVVFLLCAWAAAVAFPQALHYISHG